MDDERGRTGDPPLELTALLPRVIQGDREARDELMQRVYPVIHEIAVRRVDEQAPDWSLQATALINEAYLRVFGRTHAPELQGSRHVIATFVVAIKSALIDHARAKKARKRSAPRVGLDELRDELESRCGGSLFEFEDILEKLAERDPVLVEIVRFRFYVGMNVAEIAECLGASPRSIQRDLTFAKDWIWRELCSIRRDGLS